MKKEEKFIRRALELAAQNVKDGKGGPFGAVIVKNNEIIAEGTNLVTYINDPSAHAEIVAIREACRKLNLFQLNDCQIYSSCEPCPMCIGAIYWARPQKVFFAATKDDAAKAGFDDSFIYEQLNLEYAKRKIPMIKLMTEDISETAMPFTIWEKSLNKIRY